MQHTHGLQLYTSMCVTGHVMHAHIRSISALWRAETRFDKSTNDNTALLMDSEMIKRPNAALINREWFDSAKSVLSTDNLGHVLIAAAEYVFVGSTNMQLSAGESIVFTMIKPALDSDILKYSERCARNAANARSQRQRVGANGSEWEPMAANTTPTPTPTTTTTPISLPREHDKSRRDREQFFIALYFAEQGSEAPVQEMHAFWNYYESLGWKNNKGAAIVRKQSCAAMWRAQFATGDVCEWRRHWFKALHKAHIFDLRAFTDVRGAEIEGENLTLSIVGGKEFAEFLDGSYMPVLRYFVADMGCKTLSYRAL